MASVRADSRRAAVKGGEGVAHAAPVSWEPLLERERELAVIDRAIRHAASGRGAVVLIEGSAGIGKSRLLGAARKQCFAAGVQQLCARGGELEADVPLGVMRQLLEPFLSAEASRDPLPGSARRAALMLGENAGGVDEPLSDTYATFHSLYLLCAALARRSTVLASIDDAHLSDPPSLRFLDFLTTRLDGLAFVLVLAVRQDEASTDATALAEVAASPLNTTIRPPALSEQAVELLVRERLHTKPEPQFARACHSVTGGNPFLVRELLTDLAHGKVAPTTASAAALQMIGPRAVAASAVLRLRGLSADAVALATAVAVLGDGAPFCQAAALAELSRESATLAADALVRAEILGRGRAMSFVHPLERQAIYEGLGHGERSRLHRKAAFVVGHSGGAPDVIADHFLRVYPQRDHGVVEPLRDAARHALARGAPPAAVRYLRRALDERPSGETAAGVLLELGEAELLGGYGEALERLAQAAATATAAAGRVLALRLLATARLAAGLSGYALDAYRSAIAAAGELDADVQLQLRAELIAAAQSGLLPAAVTAEGPGRVEPNGLGHDGIGKCLLAATLAAQAMRCDQEAVVAGADIERALAGAALRERLPIESPALHVAATALCEAEAFDSAQLLIDRIVEHPRASTSMFIRAAVLARRADLAFRRGSLDQAEADARVSIDCSRAPNALGRPLAAAVLIGVLLEKDDPRAAEDLLRRDGIADAPPAELTCAYVLYARARLRAAQDRPELALQDLLECGDRLLASGAINPAIVPWRSLAALAQHRLGERQAGQRLADEELALARRFGAPRATGIALRTAAALHDGAHGVALLRDAVSVLERSGARLEYAGALADLGAAERRAGRRRQAREHLEQGHRIAFACGGTALADRCRQELAAASGRAGTEIGGPVQALTASEQRVAGLAAEGRSNRRIAQTLCISHKTVEKHLHNTYVKLGIGSRSSLANVLGG